MARYLVEGVRLAATTQPAIEETGRWLAAAVPQLGGSVESLNYSFGECDLVVLLDMPDQAAMVTLAELALNQATLKLAKVMPIIDAGIASLPRPTVEESKPPVHIAEPETEAQHFIPEDLALESPEVEASEPEVSDDVQALLADLLMGDIAPDAYDLAVGRFTRFSDLAAFTETLQCLPGIQSVVTRQFLRGMVSLRVHYDDPIPLATRLSDMQQFKPLVRSLGQNRLEMVLFAGSHEQLVA